jgi:hypothetical protein
METIFVHDPRAIEDIFTYGPIDVVRKILLDMDLEGFTRTCVMNKRIRGICKDSKFKEAYFAIHSNEILDRFDEILGPVLERREPSDSDILFMREWLYLIDDSSIKKYGNQLTRWKSLKALFTNMNANEEMIKIVLDDPRFDPSKNDVIIEWVIEAGYSNLVERLLKDPRFVPNEENLSLAILEQDDDIVKLLLRDGGVIPPKKFLVQAARNKDKDMVKLLIQYGRMDVEAVLDSLKHKKGSKKILRFIKKIHDKLPKKKTKK